jgi:hypothetical protein
LRAGDAVAAVFLFGAGFFFVTAFFFAVGLFFVFVVFFDDLFTAIVSTPFSGGAPGASPLNRTSAFDPGASAPFRAPASAPY